MKSLDELIIEHSNSRSENVKVEIPKNSKKYEKFLKETWVEHRIRYNGSVGGISSMCGIIKKLKQLGEKYGILLLKCEDVPKIAETKERIVINNCRLGIVFPYSNYKDYGEEGENIILIYTKEAINIEDLEDLSKKYKILLILTDHKPISLQR